MSRGLCVWCKKEPVKPGFALCERCYALNENDAKLGKGEYRFRCPVCGEDIGGRIICPKCGVVRMSLMSLPSHCHICHSQFFYTDKEGVTRCWCCNAEWEESYIDKYIMYALRHFDEFREEQEKAKRVGEVVVRQ